MRGASRILLVLVLLAMAGCTGRGQWGNPVPSPTTSAPTLLSMPDVVGQNADVALDLLHKLGFKNVDLGTVDGRHVVVLPQNWTVRTQSAKAGTRLAPDAKVVLGCARIGGGHWPVFADPLQRPIGLAADQLGTFSPGRTR